jgi:hypothetical protein
VFPDVGILVTRKGSMELEMRAGLALRQRVPET